MLVRARGTGYGGWAARSGSFVWRTCCGNRAGPTLSCRPNSTVGTTLELSEKWLSRPDSSHQPRGEPLVVIHGLLGNKLNWRSLFRSGPLAELSRDVLAIDVRNHGDSPHSDVMTYGSMAADVVALLDRHNIERAAIVGHSMGGKIAMQLALSAPERVSELVVCDIAPVRYSAEGSGPGSSPKDSAVAASSFPEVFKAMEALPLHDFKTRGDADAALASAIPAPGLRAFVLTNLLLEKTPGAQRTFRWRCNLPVLGASIDALMDFPLNGAMSSNQFTGPTLFIGGADSPYISADSHGLIRRLFPSVAAGATGIVSVEGAGHFVHVDQPEKVSTLIADFLSV